MVSPPSSPLVWACRGAPFLESRFRLKKRVGAVRIPRRGFVAQMLVIFLVTEQSVTVWRSGPLSCPARYQQSRRTGSSRTARSVRSLSTLDGERLSWTNDSADHSGVPQLKSHNLPHLWFRAIRVIMEQSEIDTSAKLQLLKQIPYFASLPDSRVRELAAGLREHRYRAGEVIFLKGDQCQ